MGKLAESFEGKAGATTRVASANTAAAINAAIHTQNNRPAKSMLITVEDYPVRIAYGEATAVNTPGSEVGHISPVGSRWRLWSHDDITSLSHINETDDNVGILMVTPEF